MNGARCQDDIGVEDRPGGTDGSSRDAPQPSSMGAGRQTGSACLSPIWPAIAFALAHTKTEKEEPNRQGVRNSTCLGHVFKSAK